MLYIWAALDWSQQVADFHHQNVDGADIMFSKQRAYSEVECWHGSIAIPVGFLVYSIFTVYEHFACLMFWELHTFCAASICHGETVEVYRCSHVPILRLNWLPATCKLKTIHIPVKKTINTLRPITDICLAYARSEGECTNVHKGQAGWQEHAAKNIQGTYVLASWSQTTLYTWCTV